MKPAKWQNIKKLFSAVLDLPENERREFLARESDMKIHAEVERLLIAHEKAEDFIAQPFLIEQGLTSAEVADDLVGKRIENYLILERIGTGGMGAVYLAEKVNSDFKQKVAVKVIKRGMDSEAILKRFATERRILSSLKHPNIAQLLDGGISADGLPFFVMEYVEGKPLNEFCDEKQLSLNRRLEIFSQICSAVEYAHKNLIVHRDLKPKNIIVNADGVPKLLDFGIAKLLFFDDDSTTSVTLTQGRMFTPEYASPEQILGKNVTTATDVYSLGVILYELLTGTRPHDVKGKAFDEIVKDICETEPQLPSAVSFKSQVPSLLSKNHTLDYKAQNTNIENQSNPKSEIQNLKSLRGDLDNIVLKSLRKEPSERYGSVQQFAEDISRFLRGLPILARPQTLKYRFGKYVKRHKVGVLAVALIFLSLIGGTSVATWQAIEAKRERERAERQFAETRKIANSLLFEIHDSLSDLPGSTASRELLVKLALEYLNNLSLEAGDNSELLLELSIAYRKVADIQGDPYMANTGDTSQAMQSYQKALEMQEKLLLNSPDDLNLLKEIQYTASQLGDNLFSLGNFTESEEAFQRAIKAATVIVEKESENANAYNNLSFLYLRLSWVVANTQNVEEKSKYFDLAQKYVEKALALNSEDENSLSNAIEIYSNIGNNLGNPDYNDAGKPAEALPYLQKSLKMRQQLADRNSESNIAQNSLGIGFRDLGEILLAQGMVKEAIENHEKALQIHHSLAEKDSKNSLAQGIVGFGLTKLGNALLKNAETEKALARHKESVKTLEKLHLADKENIMVAHTFAIALEGLADSLASKKQFAEAFSLYNRSLKIEEEINSKQTSLEIQLKIAQLYFKTGNAKIFIPNGCRESAAAFEKSVEIFNEAKAKSPLSPTNLKVLAESEAGLKKSGC